MKKIFISGQVTGLENYQEVKARFANVEQRLRDMGYQVFNPCRYVAEGTEWTEAMCICIGLLVKCDVIYMLQGYQSSSGARFELETASRLQKEILYEPFQCHE